MAGMIFATGLVIIIARRVTITRERSAPVASYPRILAVASASPRYQLSQDEILATLQEQVFGHDWAADPERVARAHDMAHLFTASHVAQRQSVIDLKNYYTQPRSTADRMVTFAALAPPLASAALTAALDETFPKRNAADVTDLCVVSCTGYMAPGIDIVLAREMQMHPSVRRVMVGHMGCFGALVGIRQALAAVRSEPGSTAAALCVELTSLHFMPTDDIEALTSFALFGDAAAALILADDPEATGPEIVATYCSADFATAEQMSWTITDAGFIMGLSPRVPVTLRRNIRGVMDNLLTPQGLTTRDITHWIVHPGGPSILDAIAGKLELTAEQMALSWQILREQGNCSSATVLLILEALLKSGRPQRGEWGVMMAFGPGLTLETCLLRF